MFDLLSFPPQAIDEPTLLAYPNNKSKVLLEKVEARKQAREAEAEKLAKKMKRKEKQMPQGATALDKDLAVGGKGEPVAELKQEPWLVTKPARDKITLEEKLCAFT